MNTRHRKLIILVTVLLLLLLTGGVGLWLRSAQRQYALNRRLIAALIHTDDRKALALVNDGADPNTRYTPTPVPSLPELLKQLFHRSPVAANDSATAFMMSCGATEGDDSATMEARQNRPDDSPLVQAMLRHGAKVNVKGKFGRMPLMCAVQSSRLETVRLLLEHTADVNVQDSNGLTAVHYAAIDANEPILHQLLVHGGNVNTQDNKGMTALYYAVWSHAVAAAIARWMRGETESGLEASMHAPQWRFRSGITDR